MKKSYKILVIAIVASLLLAACGSGHVYESPNEPGGLSETGGTVPSGVNVWESGNFSTLIPFKQAVVWGTNVFFLQVVKDFDPATATGTSYLGVYSRSLVLSQADSPGFGPADVVAFITVAGTTYFIVLYYADHMPAPDWTIPTVNWPSFVSDAQAHQGLNTLTAVTFSALASYQAVEIYSNPSFTLSIYGGIGEYTSLYLYETVSAESLIVATYYATTGQMYYVTTSMVSGASPVWTMTVEDWFLFTRLAVAAAGATTTVAAPPVTWPAWDPNLGGWQHAAQSRRWPILGIMLAYEALTHTADRVYFSPTMGYLLITTNDPYVGTIGSIFTAANDVLAAGGSSIVPGNPVTIIFPFKNLHNRRVRGCFTHEVFPAFGTYTPVYEPKPLGEGICKEVPTE